MAITNAKITVWSKSIQKQLKTITSLKDHCSYEFQGEIKHAENLKIVGVNRPTIRDYVIGTPLIREKGTDNGMTLTIDQQKYFDFDVEDIEQAQSTVGMIEALSSEATDALSESADIYVGTVILGAKADVAVQVKVDLKTVVDGGIDGVEEALEALYTNNVTEETKKWLEMCPAWFRLFRPAIIETDTNNSEMIKSGAVGKYGNSWVTLENNLPKNQTIASQAGCTMNILRTGRAVAFAGQINSVEAFRPHDSFVDAIKGLYTFGAKVVRPKEIALIGTYRSA